MSDLLLVRFAEQDPRRFAHTLTRAPTGEAAELLSGLAPAAAAAVAVHLPPQAGAAIIDCVSDDMLVTWLQDAALDRAAQLFARLPAKRRRVLLNSLPSARRRRQLLRLTGYSADSVGAFVHTDTMTLGATVGVAAAVDELRRQRRIPGSPLVVVGDDSRVAGVLEPLDLLAPAAPDTPLRALARRVTTILPDMPVAAALRLPDWSTRNSLPVVDFNGALLGHVMHASLLAAAEAGGGPDSTGALASLAQQYVETMAELLGLLLAGRR